MNLRRLTRLLALIGRLQTGRGHNVSALAAHCEVSRRTVFRDLEVLREAGVPLQFDFEQQTYRVNGNYYLPPTNFTPEEALSVLVLCHQFGDGAGLPFYGPARSAALKLESSLPTRLRAYVREIADAVQIRLRQTNRLDDAEPVYRTAIEALQQRQAVRIRYDSFAEARVLSTKLHPYRMLFHRRSWYLIGRSSVHRAIRTFNVGRIQGAELLEETFKVPRRFDVERYLRNAWSLIPERGPDVEVVVRFSPLVARNVAEVLWHRTQRTIFRDDGSLEFRATVSGVREISWWILGYGDQAEALEPPALRRLIAKRLAGMQQLYQSG